MEQSILMTILGYLILITNNNITKLNSTKKKTKKNMMKKKPKMLSFAPWRAILAKILKDLAIGLREWTNKKSMSLLKIELHA